MIADYLGQWWVFCCSMGWFRDADVSIHYEPIRLLGRRVNMTHSPANRFQLSRVKYHTWPKLLTPLNLGEHLYSAHSKKTLISNGQQGLLRVNRLLYKSLHTSALIQYTLLQCCELIEEQSNWLYLPVLSCILLQWEWKTWQWLKSKRHNITELFWDL